VQNRTEGPSTKERRRVLSFLKPYSETVYRELPLPLRAVIFDYGKVLTGPPDPEAHDAILKITRLSPECLDKLYWTDRHAYDEGKLTGLEYWQKFAREAKLNLSAAQLDEVNDWDARMWTTENAPMLAWQLVLKQRGFLTAILSNMGDHVHRLMQREFDWLSRFDLCVWSYELGVAKPDPAIYLHTLKEIHIMPEEALFLDDKQPNIDAACALGIRGILFQDAETLRADLIAYGFDKALPLPG